MAERDPERRPGRVQLWLGAGRRARELGALLVTLATLDAEGEARLEPPATLVVTDLEDLLTQRGSEGLLILEAARVPPEDIGFVRRFLERHPGRRLLLVGSEQERARLPFAAGRALGLAWPPHVEELRALLPAPGPPSTGRRPPEPGEGGPRAPRRPRGANGHHDLRAVLEECMAGAALLGEGHPRFVLKPGAPCPVAEDRAALLEGLGGLVELARRCAGGEGLVRAVLEAGAEGIRIGLDFPRAGLAEKDLPLLLERAPGGLAEPLEEGCRAARRGAERLQALGARVELAGGEGGRVRCEVRLAGPAKPPARPVRMGKPEDPFA